MPLGRHVRVDAHSCTSDILDDDYQLRVLLVEACETAEATVLQHGGYKFEPQGATCFVLCLLAESHAWLHTFPELGEYSLDVYTCGDRVSPQKISSLVVGKLGGKTKVEVSDRGSGTFSSSS